MTSDIKGGVPYFHCEKIAEGSWMISNAFMERTAALCYLVEGRDFALLIDTMIGCGNLKAFCQTLTDKPILLANTHAHPDHTGGNYHFDACYMHHRDIAMFQSTPQGDPAEQFEEVRSIALPEYRDLMALDDNFAAPGPMRVFPLYGGDVFDLGDRRIEVVEASGHTPGSIVLIDPVTRIAYSGDACNGNTLLEFDHSLPVADYMLSLLNLRKRQGEFDMMYGGHEIFDASILDEAIETVGRVLAGTDDRIQRTGMFGQPVLYAAAKVEGGYARADGKRFNMSYLPDKVWADAPKRQVITLEPIRMI